MLHARRRVLLSPRRRGTLGNPEAHILLGVHSMPVRVAYDIEKAAPTVKASSLPNEYADLLRKAY